MCIADVLATGVENQYNAEYQAMLEKPQCRAEAVKEIRKSRARCKPVTVEEILAWRDEGRP
ncbi:MAG: hypothetical protein LBS82_05150 [Spirochaetaceae bacterium]|jgi:hypothetical protein|nr:hypothetical protein [Spirochaetaceae bacterium]